MVSLAIDLGMDVVAIPGPTAFVQALVGSGLSCERFVFEGFLPDKDSTLRDKLNSLLGDQRTLVFYVSPHGLRKTVRVMHEVLGDRRVCLARELTKKFEEYIRVRLSELEERLSDEHLKGEFTLVVEGAEPKSAVSFDQDAARALVSDLLVKGLSSKQITADLVARFDIRKSEAYDIVIGIKNERDTNSGD
jgi:16S rRNA (cytidine1402-2'-O)-methyltransferase